MGAQLVLLQKTPLKQTLGMQQVWQMAARAVKTHRVFAKVV
ncbi:MAG: hypothetical protein ACJA1I_001846 [Zhongshania marina]|jgi:hypothetical protein